MSIFHDFIEWIAYIPAWIPLVVCPAGLIVAAVLFALFGGRKRYSAVAVILGALGLAIISARAELGAAVIYFAVYSALAALLSLLFLVPQVRHGKKKQKESREERIYRKFHEGLSDDSYGAMPPKVNCFEEPPVSAEESGMRLSYVTSLIKKLKQCKLSPADRLEVDVLDRSVDGYRGKALTERELGMLNDCFGSVLKLTAKYKL